MVQEVKELEFDYGIGTKLPFKVVIDGFTGFTPVYEKLEGKIRGGVVDNDGTYHWLKRLFDTVEEFEQYMTPYKVQETT